jgi:hypothetical protein
MTGWIGNEIISLVTLINFITAILMYFTIVWIVLCIVIIALLLYVGNYFIIVTVLRLCTCIVILQ